MKRQWTGSLGVALLAAVLAVVAVSGEAGELRCNVPFRFEVGKAKLPAGSYTVSTLQAGLMIRGYSTGAVAMSTRVESKTNDTAKLVFHRYGDVYILREAWTGRSGYKIVPPRHERELEGREVAAYETVVIPLS